MIVLDDNGLNILVDDKILMMMDHDFGGFEFFLNLDSPDLFANDDSIFPLSK